MLILEVVNKVEITVAGAGRPDSWDCIKLHLCRDTELQMNTRYCSVVIGWSGHTGSAIHGELNKRKQRAMARSKQ